MTICDRCSAEALVTVGKLGTQRTLDLCGHHYREHSLALLTDNWVITEDRRETANA